jgi:hypothetical protein
LQTINTNSQEKIYLQVYSDGILSQADSLPTLSIYNADNDNSPLTGFSGLNAYDESPSGVYSFLLTSAITNINQVLEICWSYSINGLPVVQTDYYQIETPYATVSETIDFLQFGSEPSYPNYVDPKSIVSAEKVARTIIEGYTGIKFYTYYGGQEIYGIGANTIQLTEKMLSLDQIYENEILVYDKTQNPIYDTFGYNTEISPSGYQIRIWFPGWQDGWNNEMDPEIYEYGRFRDNYLYRFVGQIGYKYVPEDIKLASMLLINDILSNDYNWRNKYLSQVNLSEISFNMAGGAFNGTGNITVDNILDQYRKANIVII